MKRVLIAVFGLLMLTTACTPRQITAWREWHRHDPGSAEEFLQSDVGLQLINDGAQASAQTERLDPPDPPSDPPSDGPPAFSSTNNGSRCTGAEPLLAYYSPGWSVTRMSGIMYRESRCDPSAKNSSSTATGLLQILASHCSRALDCTSASLRNPHENVRVGAQLWRMQGYGAWAQTS